jgi:hypothetical protein
MQEVTSMKSRRCRLTFAFLGAMCAAMTLASGCQQTDAVDEHAGAGHDHEHGEEHGDDHAHGAAGHTHGAWWCDLHGVPEKICGQCDSDLAAELQKKGDWCDEHDRPDSQCFKCHPELETRFAAQYEAKYGKKPPKPQG